ncbi:MAG: YtxH domain-containing protein [Tannerella sp.]|jgi:gas vesicle protein|nr:YtxH domain-containing protein [Tannerella sp.]
MKSNVDSKLLLGLVIGGVVGAAVGYLIATDKKEQILDELNEVAGKIKNSFLSTVDKYRDRILDAGTGAATDTEEAAK